MDAQQKEKEVNDILVKTRWISLCLKAGAKNFNSNSYPDIHAVDGDGRPVGFWDGTDSTGQVTMS